MTTEILGYWIDDQIYESHNSFVYRGCDRESNRPVILKMLKQASPPPEKIAWFKREYERTRDLDLPGVIDAYRLETDQHRWVIVLEDFGGQSLDLLMRSQSFTLREFLSIATQVADILGQIHQRHVIHKDINPSNIVLNPTTGQLKLIDFGISTTLTRENPSLRNPNVLEGTLAYISPEQTGRMNRATDYRTDFYSLGVTFYQLLTGQLPFQTTDAMELVHAHIAKHPPSPHKLKANTPQPLSDIVMKLMAKNAEDRYQSAYGLKVDLEECQRQWQTTGQIDLFSIGEQDVSDKFQIPQKLYGREKEIDLLMSAFERVSQGNSEIVLVSGYSGIGKSALVKEIHKPITRQHGYFIAGKFDQLQRDIPYASLVQAFRSLIQQLLLESEAEIARWHQELLASFGPNGQVIIDVIPEVALIVGPQPTVPTLAPAEARNRFNLTFQNFIKVFAKPEHPLVLFLDDLQWADSASLDLTQRLMTASDSRNLLVIGAYRDNEVGKTHPLILTLKDIQQAGAIVNEIVLKPLDLSDVGRFIADALNQSPETTKPLAELVLAKTGGNPFFINEFLKSLYTEALLTFDPSTDRGTWRWDLAQIRSRNITDNVVELMMGKVQKLSPKTQEALKLSACIGNYFDLRTLMIVYQNSAKDTAADLWDAMVEGLISPLDDTYKLMELDVEGLDEAVIVDYKFTHDRIQQAAYSLIPEEDKQQVHRQIGQLLLKKIPTAQQEQKIFDIVNQLNQGLECISTQAEQDELVELNLIAGRKAKASAAYQPAFNYLQIGLALLARSYPVKHIDDYAPDHDLTSSADSWHRLYDLTLSLHMEASEAAYLSGDYEKMEQLTEIILHQAKTLLDKVKAYEVRMRAYYTKYMLPEVVETGLNVLPLFDVTFPEEPNQADTLIALEETKSALAGKQIEKLVDLPEMEDPYRLAAMRILWVLMNASALLSPELSTLVTLKAVDLSIKHGSAPQTPSFHACFGTLMCGAGGDIELGYQFGKLSLRLGERLMIGQPQAVYLFNAFIRHWKEHAQKTIKPFLDVHQSCLETGDLTFATFSIFMYLSHSFWVGQELNELNEEMIKYMKVVDQLNWQGSNQSWNEMYRQTVLNLLGRAESPHRIIGESYNEEKMLPIHQQANDSLAICYLYLNKLVLCYLFEQYDQAVENAAISEDHLGLAMGMQMGANLCFYDSLAQLAVFPHREKRDQDRILEKVTTNQQRMKTSARHAPMNYQHKYYLVEAEYARVLGKDEEARTYYDRAIDLAHENGYVHEEALANELAGKFYVARNQDRLARHYLRDAHYTYLRWGAAAKVQDLEKRYPQFLAQDTTASVRVPLTTTSTERPSSALDLASVLKASQTISGEIMLDALLAKMMKIVVENAGAEKGLLLLEKGGRWVIEAEGRVDQAEVKTLQAIPVAPPKSPPEGGKKERDTLPEGERMERDAPSEEGTKEKGSSSVGETKGGDALLPISIINYVARTQENVVLNDAVHEGAFTQDGYVMTQQPKSILCMPLINQAKLIGLLYLENNLTTGAFTEDRIEVLSLLSSQAAVSLENARLYDNLATSEQRFRTLFENAPLCVFEVDLDQTPPVILAANRQAELVYGWSAEDLAAQPAGQLVPPEAMAEVDQMVARVQAGETVSLETSTRRRDGTVFPVRLSATPEKGPGLSRMIVTVEDITLEKERRFEAEAIDEERRRIAHEIHDGLAQDLAALRFKTTLWHDLVDADPAKMHDELDLLQETLNGSIREVRRSIFALRPIALDELGFFPALHQFTTHFGEQYELQVRLRIDGPKERLPATLELPLFRVIQEALNNIGKHAQANVVQINLDLASPEAITLTVQDDGVGFDPVKLNQRVREGHVGLKQMRERVESINGSHSIQSQVGQGTEVQVVLPLSSL